MGVAVVVVLNFVLKLRKGREEEASWRGEERWMGSRGKKKKARTGQKEIRRNEGEGGLGILLTREVSGIPRWSC